MADRVVGDFASDISAPFNDQPAGDRLTTSRQATAAAPIQVPSVSIIAASLRQKKLPIVASPPARKTGWKHRRHLGVKQRIHPGFGFASASHRRTFL